MKKYYVTSSPNQAPHILIENLQEAIDKAKSEVESNGKVRYVVQIVRKVEIIHTPVKVTVVR